MVMLESSKSYDVANYEFPPPSDPKWSYLYDGAGTICFDPDSAQTDKCSKKIGKGVVKIDKRRKRNLGLKHNNNGILWQTRTQTQRYRTQVGAKGIGSACRI